MRSLESRGGAAELLHIEPLRIEADAVFKERIADIAIVYFIYIFLFYTRADRVEILVDLDRVRHGDIVRQAGVDRERHALHGDVRLGMEVCAVAQRVDACVSSAAADDLRARAEHLFQRFLDGLRDAYFVFLDLPAVVAAPVIAQAQSNIFHNYSPNFFKTIIPARNAAPVMSAAQSMPCICRCFILVRPSPPW